MFYRMKVAGLERDLEKAFQAFLHDPLVALDTKTARELFDRMVQNTRAYLESYFA